MSYALQVEFLLLSRHDVAETMWMELLLEPIIATLNPLQDVPTPREVNVLRGWWGKVTVTPVKVENVSFVIFFYTFSWQHNLQNLTLRYVKRQKSK